MSSNPFSSAFTSWASQLTETVSAAFDSNAPAARVERMLQKEKDGDFNELVDVEPSASTGLGLIGTARSSTLPSPVSAPNHPEDVSLFSWSGLKESLLSSNPVSTVAASLINPILKSPSESPSSSSSLDSHLPWKTVPHPKHAMILEHMIREVPLDERHLTTPPPSTPAFTPIFRMSKTQALMAAALLEADPALKEARFRLVPKVLKEDVFWRNYMYRVDRACAQVALALESEGNSVDDLTVSGITGQAAHPQTVSDDIKQDVAVIIDMSPQPAPAGPATITSLLSKEEVDGENMKKINRTPVLQERPESHSEKQAGPSRSISPDAFTDTSVPDDSAFDFQGDWEQELEKELEGL